MGKKYEPPNFIEIAHTADVAMQVFGEDLSSLFKNAAIGMYSLLGVQADESKEPCKERTEMNESDPETLLVSFLTELLYFIEKGFYYKEIQLEINGRKLNACMSGFPIQSVDIEIKAVTFNDLKIEKVDAMYATKIVFDV